MSFSKYIPGKVLDSPNTLAFVNVMDALQTYKDEIMFESFRVNNVALLTDRKWLIKKFEEFGVTDMPIDYPIGIMQQYLLNMDTICRTRGSKKGIELYCSVLTLGEVSVDDSRFFSDVEVIFPDHLIQGYITADNEKDVYYLLDDSDLINPNVEMTISINSKYFDGSNETEASIIKEYLEKSIKNQIGFYNGVITFNYYGRDTYFYHELLNPYFK